MPLTDKQRAALEAKAKEAGVDAAKLIAEAESLSGGGSEREVTSEAGAGGEPPKLFMYHLPFVRVREVRRIWLGLDESFPGDEAIAAEWAAKFAAGGGGGETPPEVA